MSCLWAKQRGDTASNEGKKWAPHVFILKGHLCKTINRLLPRLLMTDEKIRALHFVWLSLTSGIEFCFRIHSMENCWFERLCRYLSSKNFESKFLAAFTSIVEKSQEFSNVRVLQIFEFKVVLSILNSRKILKWNLFSTDSVTKSATRKLSVFWDLTYTLTLTCYLTG